MADKKISQLTGATTPLAGTEVLPIVQSGSTVKVAVSNLTAGRDVSVKNLTTTGSATFAANLYHYIGGTQFFAGDGSVTNYLFSGGTNMVWRNKADSTTLLTLANSTGDFTLSTGNLVIGTSGKGIDFSATPGTGTSELLADYEEGTWTPAFDQFTVGNGSVTGRYTKIGRVVTVIANLTFGSTSSWAGTCTAISNLPFTSAARSVGLISFFRAGTGWYSGQTVLNSGVANTVYPGRYDNTSINATSPFTWAATDYLVLQMTYEA